MSGRRYRVVCAEFGSYREGDEPEPMMYGHEKSDFAIVAVKSANNAKQSAAEPVERWAETKGNAGANPSFGGSQ